MKKVTFTLLAGTMVLAMLATGCKKDDPTPTPTPAPASLYTRLGGNDAIVAVTDKFISNVVADPILAQEFVDAGTTSNTSQFNLFREHLIDQLVAGTGGPDHYRGKTMLAAHTGMNITDEQFTHLVTALTSALNTFSVGATEQADLLAILGPMKADIVGH